MAANTIPANPHTENPKDRGAYPAAALKLERWAYAALKRRAA